MRKIFWFSVVVLALSAFSLAEDTSVSKVDVFGGYSFMRTGNGALVSGTTSNLNGWNAAFTGNFNKYLGLTADVSGLYNGNLSGTGVDGKAYTFLFGPTVSYRTGSRITPFAHALFGVSRLSGTVASTSDSSFAMAVGGGADLKVSPKFSLRLAQLDWMRTNYFSTTQNNMRLSTGVVLHF